MLSMRPIGYRARRVRISSLASLRGKPGNAPNSAARAATGAFGRRTFYSGNDTEKASLHVYFETNAGIIAAR